ncbi:allene oxide cyclase barrel-like domain-containing protein [Streptomyces canus]|uniref:allene oxide cyclase barrel-like domain-containing protein n=2 Tax=Streptomyces canus TaxID=58343 RepID=UPI002DD9E033|nr:hypothetical protein [Streptomyces canus]WSD83010.1 hypothetical protein OG925_00950 [Streptomyces canus]WSD91822.1 hypothetical protein OG925_49530 [Streptomyces canus]
MRLWKLGRMRVMAPVAALLACTTVVGLNTLPANADQARNTSGDQARSTSADQASKKCRNFHWREKMPTFDTNMPPAEDVPAGFQANWFDVVYDWETGEKVGTAVGAMNIIYERKSDGHDIEFQWEMFHLPDGTFQAGSSFDRMDVIEGNWITQPVEGVSGVYRGWKGKWTWRALFEIPDAPPDFEAVIEICPR